MYVLDTNAVSELMKGNPRVLERLQAVDRVDVVVPQPVLAELAYGVERLPRSRRKEWLRVRLGLVQQEIGRAEWTDAVSGAFGTIKAQLEKRGRRLEDLDIAIAAHALATDGILVTADHGHMSRIAGLTIEELVAARTLIAFGQEPVLPAGSRSRPTS